ncbi:hypothetical protein [Tropicibacter naphthalenivorans]|uniref:Uncharacterized protein n=1 Tax=Tropicibacter naphthalenivorans TaxID=441103 RepID=A0A0P1GTJ6_9RHOB|nr:hypothetical protein [Tropicibacter naphthalenivorans]CUH77907.1 hypothetical protein TRN7648_01682 [Tropicibacter naphthalenivorans]SMC95201.1 hypothetical protein SAMN04488093_107159 [Tropicibacter naphthalenivorans]
MSSLTWLVLSGLVLFGALAVHLYCRRRLAARGISLDDIGRRTLATPLGLVSFWVAVVMTAVHLTSWAAFTLRLI